MFILITFIEIILLSGFMGTLHMIRGRGLSDGVGIVDILAKMYIFAMMLILIAMTLDTFIPAVSFFLVMSLFWLKPGKSMQIIFLREEIINKPDWLFYDKIIDKLCGNPTDTKGLKRKALIYNIGYTITALPGFLLLGFFATYNDLPNYPVLVCFLGASAWPFVVRLLMYSNEKWKLWQTAEFIIGAYLSFWLLLAWFLIFILR